VKKQILRAPRSGWHAPCGASSKKKKGEDNPYRPEKTPQTPSDQVQTPKPHLSRRSAVGDTMAATAQHDRFWGTAPPTFRPIVMPRQAAAAPAPRTSSGADPTSVSRSDIVLPFPIRVRRLHGRAMTNAYWIITHAAYGLSATCDARLAESEGDIAD